MSNTSVVRVHDKGLSFLSSVDRSASKTGGRRRRLESLVFFRIFHILRYAEESFSTVQITTFAHVSGLLDWIISTREP